MRKQSIVISVVVFLLLAAMIVTSFAWLGLDKNSIKTQISGSLVTEYFHCGSGTENDPFVITRPIHYYHMVEFFQRLTHLPTVIYSTRDQTVVKFGEEYLYFQIGCPESQLYDPSLRPSTDENTEYFVFDYSSTGELNTEIVAGLEHGVKSKTLNMAYYSGNRSLMPVGTSQVPFNGQLDGKGITVKNLSITTTSTVKVDQYDSDGNIIPDITPIVRNTCDVGVFGYIGPGGIPHGGSEAVVSSVKNVYFDNVTIDLSDIDPDAIQSTDADGIPAHNTSSTIHNNNTCYAGYLAGHITLASTMEDVYINNSTIVGGGAAQIGYGYFGCVEKPDGGNITALGSTISLLRGKGNDAGFGGSIDMRSMYTRLNRIAASINQNTSYVPTEETVVINDETGQRVSYITNTAQANRVNQNGANLTFRYYSSTLGGSYFFNTANGYTNYIYLTGLNTYLRKTTNVYHITTDDTKEAYIISDSDNRKFLGVSSALNVISINSDGATRWNLTDWTKDNDTDEGYLTTLVGQSTYYLTYTGSNLVLTTDKALASVWYHNGSSFSDELYVKVNETPYYLVYEDGWRMTSSATTYVIGDNNGHYLSIGANGIETSISAVSATEWSYIKNNANSTISIYTTTADGIKYLSFNNGLGLSSTAFNWNYSEDEGKITLYTTSNGTNYYLTYDGGWTTIILSGYYLSSNGNYLSAKRDLNGVETTKSTSSLSVWQLSSIDGSETTIYIDYDGTKYYLGCEPSTGTLVLSDTPTTWHKNGDKYYCVINGVDNYLAFDDNYGWMTKTSNIYLIQADSTKAYLAIDFEEISNTGVYIPVIVNDTTGTYEYGTWKIDNPRGDSLIYMTIEGVNYYLCVVNGSLAIRTPTEEVMDDDGNVLVSAWEASSATIWNLDNTGRYVVSNNNQSYLSFENGTWKLTELWYTIGNGNGQFLTGVPGNTTDSNINDAKWHFSNDAVISSNSGSTRIWILRNGVPYYLGFNGSSLVSTTTPDAITAHTTWTKDSYGFYVTVNNAKYYLTYENGSWKCVVGSYIKITSDGNNNYLTINNSNNGILSNNALTESAKWQFSDGKLYCYISAIPYYLNVSNSLQLSVSNTAGANSWKQDGTKFYVSIGGYDYYLTCDNGTWKMIIKNYYTISNDQGHYMSLNGSNNGIVDSTSINEKSMWQFDAEGHILCPIGENKYYVNLNNGQLAVGATATTVWRRETKSIYYSTQGDAVPDSYDYHVYSIICNANTWGIQDDHHGLLIHDGNGNYLKANSGYDGFENTTDVSQATRWVFSTYSGDNVGSSQGSISTTNGAGQKRYIYHSNTGGLALNTNTAEWVNEEGVLKFSYNRTGLRNYVQNYYLVYDKESNSWVLERSRQGFYISDGKDHYLSIVANNGNVVIASTNKENAVMWSGKEGNISAEFEGEEYYLRVNRDNDTLYVDTSPDSYSWIHDSNKLSIYKNTRLLFFSTYYYLRYNNGWTLTTSNNQATSLKFDGNDEKLNSLVSESPLDLASITISNSISSIINGTANQINGDVSSLTISKSSIGSNLIATFPTGDISAIATNITKTSANIEIPSVLISEKEKASYNILLTKTAGQTITGPEVLQNQASGYATYFPLRLELQDENNNTSFYSDYRVSQKNTGYVVSGAHQSSGNYHSDIRVSQYPTSNISRALNTNNTVTFNDTYNARLQVLTRTITSNGVVRIQDSHNEGEINNYNAQLPATAMTVEALGLTKYELVNPKQGDVDELSRNQLADVLMGTRNIYGLHFMESTINKKNTIYADQITVNGETYYNYELPEDCIDCWLIERGSINFFAGTYYSSAVTSFFSLHQIFRDSNNQITAILELSKVYQTKNGVKDRYIYQYTDGSYSDGYTSLPAGYELVFDLDWITNKNNSSLIQNALYYFEVPVNAGEYALGSVEGKVGAYLLYLDIAANGGATIESTISGDGNEVTDAFRVEYRTSPDQLEDGFYSVLQFSINAPEIINNNEFSVNVSFDNNPGNVNYSKGLYTITIVNKTDVPVTLDVLLCDDDREPYNSFLYAYEIKYVNNNHPTETRILNNGESYFQSMASFTIPASGDAVESSYDNS